MLLSICIPTHQGRRDNVREAVDSVLVQLTPEMKARVEVCVSDNASQDGTEEAIRGYGDAVRYNRNEVNLGFARNLQRLVEMASGEFCWFLGSDDWMEPGAVKRVLDLLDRHPDTTGMTVNRRNFDRALERQLPPDPPGILPEQPDRVHAYRTAGDIFLNCGVTQTYVSAQVFRRGGWLEVVGREGMDSLAERFLFYPTAYIFGRMVQEHPVWLWCPDPLVRYRHDNDDAGEFMRHDAHRHVVANMVGVADAWGALFGRRSSLYRELMRKYFWFTWTPGVVNYCKVQPQYGTRDELAMLAGFTRHLYFLPEFWTRTFPSLLAPHRVHKSFGRELRAIKKRAGQLLGRR